MYEPYGKVQIPQSSYSSMSYRNTSVDPPNRSSYVLPTTPSDKNRRANDKSRLSAPHYAHNAATLSFLVPSLASVLWYHDSIIVLQVFLFIGLGLYALDLMNSRDGVAVGVWIAALGMTIASGCGTLLKEDDSNVTSISFINFLLQFAVEGMSFCAWVSGIWIKNFVQRWRNLSNLSKTMTGMLDHITISMVVCRSSIISFGYGISSPFAGPSSVFSNFDQSSAEATFGLSGSGYCRYFGTIGIRSVYDAGYDRYGMQSFKLEIKETANKR